MTTDEDLEERNAWGGQEQEKVELQVEDTLRPDDGYGKKWYGSGGSSRTRYSIVTVHAVTASFGSLSGTRSFESRHEIISKVGRLGMDEAGLRARRGEGEGVKEREG
jgi:hypothetical protein